ncbi:adenosylcobinamide-phosphate synthase CbiB [Solirubrobacter soli]|uniref:adenosylcobinamide-phosphate synthase CbiB n=1 Tax=Solirubrobacter soli TaxID=363832 RepID=UPI00041E5946|nr:adenosylcobinamide-phosphate synthase CbiB [Solirubrobacter soli]
MKSAVVLGVGADVLFGDPRRGHPVAAFGSVAGAFERVAYRPARIAGAAYAAVLVGGAVVLGVLLERALGRRLAGAVCLWVALGGRSLAREAAAVGELVARDDLAGARRRIRSLVGRDPEHLDAAGLSRAVVESVAENTVDAVIAPLVWLRVGGAPGVLAHRAVNTLDAMVGNRSERYERFGMPAARADDVMNWPAARLAAALTVLLSGRPVATWRAWRADAAAHPSPNAGQIEAAFAGALGVQLGGTLAYAGRVEHRPRLGDGREPGPRDIARAISFARRISLATALLTATPWRRR